MFLCCIVTDLSLVSSSPYDDDLSLYVILKALFHQCGLFYYCVLYYETSILEVSTHNVIQEMTS